MKIIDISTPITEDMTVYPGDPRVRINRVKTFKEHKLLVSEISMGLHAGTHVDAPLHYFRKGKPIDRVSLDFLTGKAIVCDLSDTKDDVGEDDLKNCAIEEGDIVLIKTAGAAADGKKKHRSQTYLGLKGAEYLIRKKNQSRWYRLPVHR